MTYRRPTAYAPKRDVSIKTHRALSSLLKPGWGVQGYDDAVPDFADSGTLILPLKSFTRVGRLAIERGGILGVREHGKSVSMQPAGIADFYDFMRDVAWSERGKFPQGVVHEAQFEIARLLSPHHRIPDFLIEPTVHANGLVANTIPSPPPDIYSRHFRTWVERTFPPGSTFRWGGFGSGVALCRVASIRGTDLIYKIVPGVRDRHGGFAAFPLEEQEALFERTDTPIPFDRLREMYLNGEIRPMVGHWAPFQAAPSMKHRRLAPNAIPPPPPTWHYDDLADWAKRTYAPGTPVRFETGRGMSWYVTRPDGTNTNHWAWVPPGTRGEVEGVHYVKGSQAVWITVRVHDARRYVHAAGAAKEEDVRAMWDELDEQKTNLVSKLVNDGIPRYLVPLEDNWAPLQQKKRTSYRGRYTAPNRRRTSRRPMRRNAGWDHAAELRRAAAHYRQAAQQEGLHSDESRRLIEQAREMTREAEYQEKLQREAAGWLGGGEVPPTVDEIYDDDRTERLERERDEAAPRWRPGFESPKPAKRRTSRRATTRR